eukprot:274023-Rhodomonas_salina.2
MVGYAMRGTGLRCAYIVRCDRHAMSGTCLDTAISCYAVAMRCSVVTKIEIDEPMQVRKPIRCPVLTKRIMRRYLLSQCYASTELAYGGICLRICYGLAYNQRAQRALGFPGTTRPTTCLRARYAMSDTAIAYGMVCIRVCYAMSGTEIAYTVVCTTVMSGTGIWCGRRAVQG